LNKTLKLKNFLLITKVLVKQVASWNY